VLGADKVILISNQAALQAYQRGEHELALKLAEESLGSDPSAADAMLAILLIRLRMHDADASATMIKRLGALRSADWLLQAVREDYRVRGAPHSHGI